MSLKLLQRGVGPVTRRRLTLGTIVLLAVPSVASACPVCFGVNDGPMLQGSNMGILALLLVTLAVLGAFGVFFRSLAQRAHGAIEANRTHPAAPAASVSGEGVTR